MGTRFAADALKSTSSTLPTARFLCPEFRSDTAYLDIETTGMNGAFDDITVIGLYNGCRLYHYILGENLHEFKEAIHRYKVLVTEGSL